MPPQIKPQTTRNRKRCLAIIITGIVLKTLILIALILIFLPIRNPILRFKSITIEKLTSNHSTASPSLSISFSAQLTVTNPNFGRFEFPNGVVSIHHGDSVIGHLQVPGASVGARITRRLDKVAIAARAVEDRFLAGELGSGKIKLSGEGKLNGKIRLLMVFERRKTGIMNCRVDVNVRTQIVEELNCL